MMSEITSKLQPRSSARMTSNNSILRNTTDLNHLSLKYPMRRRILYLTRIYWPREAQRTFFKSDMVISPRFGRPFGGRCWLVRSSIEVIQCDILNESISILKFKINNRYVCVIGVYLPYDDNKQNSYAQYSSILLCLGELVKDFISENFSVIIGGDFNADISRGKRFDVLLQQFIKDGSKYSCCPICSRLNKINLSNFTST